MATRTKYKKTFQEMLDNNEALFNKFKKAHKKYEESNGKEREDFDEMGEEVLATIRDYENILCNTSETTGYGQYSTGLSEKFWGLIRENFPKIDEVGVE